MQSFVVELVVVAEIDRGQVAQSIVQVEFVVVGWGGCLWSWFM